MSFEGTSANEGGEDHVDFAVALTADAQPPDLDEHFRVDSMSQQVCPNHYQPATFSGTVLWVR